MWLHEQCWRGLNNLIPTLSVFCNPKAFSMQNNANKPYPSCDCAHSWKIWLCVVLVHLHLLSWLHEALSMAVSVVDCSPKLKRMCKLEYLRGMCRYFYCNVSKMPHWSKKKNLNACEQVLYVFLQNTFSTQFFVPTTRASYVHVHCMFRSKANFHLVYLKPQIWMHSVVSTWKITEGMAMMILYVHGTMLLVR